jgi:hypothetical protein
MKMCWQRAIVDFESKVMCNVLKAKFLTVWAPAYLEAFDESTTCTAFKVTGIVPFNPNFVTEEQMKPSQATSTCGDTGGKSQHTWIPGASEACGLKATMWNTKGLQRSLGQQRTDKGGTKDRKDLLAGENPACPLSHLF